MPPRVGRRPITSTRQQQYNGQRCAGKLYPVAVSCVDYVQVRSKITLVLTTKTSTKTLPSSTVTVTSYTVSTSTSTVVPPEVSTTSSFSTTVSTTTTATFQATTTTTTTTTLTVTSTLAGYDACATNNLLGPSYNGDIIDNESAAAGGYSTDPSATTAYDCCVSCLNSDTCSGTAFLTDGNLCLQITGATCTNVQQNAGSFYYEPSGQGTGDSYIVSNSNCGYLTDGGVGG